MPFPYVDAADFKRELPFERADVPGIDTQSEWDGLLEEALKAESERLEGYTSGYSWRDGSDTVPFVVRMGVIRLARQRLAGVEEDGLASESTASGSRRDYRPPEALRSEVQKALAEAGYRTQVGISVPKVK